MGVRLKHLRSVRNDPQKGAGAPFLPRSRPTVVVMAHDRSFECPESAIHRCSWWPWAAARAGESLLQSSGGWQRRETFRKLKSTIPRRSTVQESRAISSQEIC